MFTVMLLSLTIYIIIYNFGTYKLFKKMNIEGYKALIPLYNEYTLYKLYKNNFNNKINTIFFIISCILYIGVIFGIIICIYHIISLVFLGSFAVVFGYEAFSSEFEETTNIIFTTGIFICTFLVLRIIIKIPLFYKISLDFGKDKNTSLMLAIFNFIGVIILGIDKSTYNNYNLNNKKVANTK